MLSKWIISISVQLNSNKVDQEYFLNAMKKSIGVALVWMFNQSNDWTMYSGFFFRLAAVDVERISRDMDFQALQDNLEQITLCNIDAEIVSLNFKRNKKLVLRW